MQDREVVLRSRLASETLTLSQNIMLHNRKYPSDGSKVKSVEDSMASNSCSRAFSSPIIAQRISTFKPKASRCNTSHAACQCMMLTLPFQDPPTTILGKQRTPSITVVHKLSLASIFPSRRAAAPTSP